ncbi:hypothetical protein MJO28_006461 [Puccinia striiformis f. sp. tritici]|uniref:EXS domain-containing protein n=2 Tax=Puccinia striiformis f. sp. tritici TaxID=168172 RepID=A0A0L0VIS6_9BASI|nr:hypothetical protein MJO28_006461 [Puccinia striiformis f. sp. tritici]KAI7958222.1 hypothetical protein MJO29_006439 [Puccinia striiformis f. sp. tritici]KNE99111.1 hypothetical protein PSTG_07591 [Puccinia striiformis f. sp. tritici PST-78]KNE99112.1 hypothetical protein, variant [Puccinia striiformis f. sp. tritici PST-78]
MTTKIEELELDFFRTYYPQPFRILTLIQFSILTSAISLQYYHHHHPRPHPTQSASSATLHSQLYYGSLSLSIVILLGLITNQILIRLLPVFTAELIQLISSIPAFIILIFPLRIAPFSEHFRNGHRRFHAAIKRIFRLFPSRNIAPDFTSFPDVIIADLLTSVARPIADLALLLATTINLNLNLQSSLSIIFNSLPYLLRFKQCINDVIIGSDHHQKLKSGMNALKYSTAIPMIMIYYSIVIHPSLSTKTKEESIETSQVSNQGDSQIWRVETWVIACLVNSIYSTWWDIVNDWGFSIKQILSWYHKLHHQDHHHHHRKADLENLLDHPQSNNNNRILFNTDQWWIYLLIIISNVLLRQTWIINLFLITNNNPPHDHDHHQQQQNLRISFMLQTLEVFRRSIWLLLRLESAEISSSSFTTRRESSNNGYNLLDLADHEIDEDDEQDPSMIKDDELLTSINTDDPTTLPLLLHSSSSPNKLPSSSTSSSSPHRSNNTTHIEIIRDLADTSIPSHSITNTNNNTTFFHHLNRKNISPPSPIIPPDP